MSILPKKLFADLKVIRKASPANLRRLVEPFRNYLRSRGYDPPCFSSPSQDDLELLASIIVQPTEETPGEFSGALFLVNGLASPAASDLLVEEAQAMGLPLEGTESLADLAIMIHLADPEAARRCHGKLLVDRMRTYESYQTDRQPLPEFRVPDAQTLERLRLDLERWFEGKLRGRGVCVITSGSTPWFGLIVRHGDLIRREGALGEDGSPDSIVYRPEKYDAAFYHAALGELRINARSKGDKNKYRMAIGEHLFGNADFFPPTQERYTLEPLRRAGRESLHCGDVPGIREVRLTALKLYFGGAYSEVRVIEGSDVLGIFEKRGKGFPMDGVIKSATFALTLENSKRPRKLTVRTPNVASFSRDADSPMIEEWLARRGFASPAPLQEVGHAIAS